MSGDLDKYLASLPSRKERATPPSVIKTQRTASTLPSRTHAPPSTNPSDPSRPARKTSHPNQRVWDVQPPSSAMPALETQVRALALAEKEEQQERHEIDTTDSGYGRAAPPTPPTASQAYPATQPATSDSAHKDIKHDPLPPIPTVSSVHVPHDTMPPIPTFSFGSDNDTMPPIPTFSFGSDNDTMAIPTFSFGEDGQPDETADADVIRPLHCCACDQLIRGMAITAAARRWHPECFKCQKCHQELEHIAFYEKDGAIFCALDYHELFTTRCHYCQTPIENKSIFALEKYYHVGHLFCRECGMPFHEDSTFIEHDGHAYCQKDYLAKFSQKCKGCDETITNEYIEALGAKWHPACFVCVDCGKVFDNGTFYVRNKLPYCEFHCRKLKQSPLK
ncbi:hypothetical protein DM01DRAFT_1317770 [Hesseltinella vesiculosa]|uniref:LIM zinc-binding domain-containing protein n=1 Tax=Hesseltinella vesiculosa TaxID=101127 RepID=A0A1X2GRB5_9FUNG|nr:hypothetical protein DM01DRAFT_1317770 [Hesseltinella vesiculosa]